MEGIGYPVENLFLQQSSNFLIHRNPVIKKLVTALMMMLFVFSITPRKLLHDFVAHHKDAVPVAAGDNPVFSAAGFNCKTDNLVAVSPFTGVENDFEPAVFYVFPQKRDTLLLRFYSSPYFYFELRGPPAC
jgi:hypothetical protein